MEANRIYSGASRDDGLGIPPRPLGACEACRAVKLKCHSRPQGGPCRRCSESKRECVYRARPRTRVSRAARTKRDSPAPRSGDRTFSIDFRVSGDDAVGPAFDNLLRDHESYIDSVLPSTPLDLMPLPSPPTSSASPAAYPQTRTVQSLCLQPQFNLESATSHLDVFRHMLPHFPCILLGDEETVASLARDRPFVLIAILASVSGSWTLQGHTLYDDEFRKVLALKVVAGGERSLELVEGLLIYCAWFPFHLRPKHKRAYQYLRMLVDMVRDLELDQSPSGLNSAADITTDSIDAVRAYLSCYYLVNVFNSFWPKANNNHADMKSTPWTSTCCTALASVSPHPQDHVLTQLSRHAYIIREAAEASRKPHVDGDQTRLVMLGLEAQLREWKSQVPAHVSATRQVITGDLSTEIFVYCAPLLRFPSAELSGNMLAPDPDKVSLAVPLLRRYYEEVAKMDLGRLSAPDWARLIIAVILGIRLSFPIKGFPWDDCRARAKLQLGEFLRTLRARTEVQCPDGRNNIGNIDIEMASRRMFDVVRKKYLDRLERYESFNNAVRVTCPVLDGSLDEYLRMWDGESVGDIVTGNAGDAFLVPAELGLNPGTWSVESGSGPGSGDGVVEAPAYHDLWSTMTLSWGENEADSFDC